MASRSNSTRTGTRMPFADVTSWANAASTANAYQPQPHNYTAGTDENSHMTAAKDVFSSAAPPVQHISRNTEQSDASKRNSTASKDSRQTSDSRRVSQYSSCDGFPNKKSHIGPWQLGKTLGKGSSARVRAARHLVTHQPVAVKIIAKKTARMTQSGSIAQLDQADSDLPENIDGVRRMPLAIEREVAILKLIEHPSIVKLYDIWENRNEIYLIMEYVENGDLFTYVSCNGALTEEASIFVFRQMMSAVQYCHKYNICHRDLKPENILLKSDGQIKIADFGMAALHQGPRYHLHTSCGSPHYAAPELLKARPYRGDKADIWSMGVILFVMLAGRLPFDEDDMSVMLAKAKKGIYTMPGSFSSDAKDLIHRILQVDPKVRINMDEMWYHPLVWKYGYVDDLGENGVDGGNIGGRDTQIVPLDLTNIDTQIFRQLRSMWHTLREDDLASKLVSNEQNDQKLFYWLLYNYRERQLENFNPTLTHSVSDYHHVNKATYSKKVSTRQFSQQKTPGHKRSVSRFTVISNVAETDAGTEYGTVKSYDPYKASLVMHPQDVRASHAKIVVHRNNSDVEAEVRSILQAESLRARSASMTGKRLHSQQRRGTSGSLRQSKSAVGSIRSTRSNGRRGPVRPAARYRRGVDFSYVRKPVGERQRSISTAKVSQSQDAKLTWNEDLSDFSYKIAKDLDEAFMSSLLTADIAEGQDGRNSPFSLRLGSQDVTMQDLPPPSPPAVIDPVSTVPTAPTNTTGPHPWDSRPLPPSPLRTDSVQFEILQAEAVRYQHNGTAFLNSVRPNSTPLDAVVPLDSSEPFYPSDVPAPLAIGDRRVVSAPVYSQTGKAARQLPAINEATTDIWQKIDLEKPRTVSAPSGRRGHTVSHDNERLSNLASGENTIRVVVSPTTVRSKVPVVIQKPLSIKKNISRSVPKAPAIDTLQRRSSKEKSLAPWQNDERPQQQLTTVEEVNTNESFSSDRSSGRSRRSWFRRQSKAESQNSSLHSGSLGRPSSQTSQRTDTPLSAVSNVPQAPTSKKSFVFPFWKGLKSDSKLVVAETEEDTDMAGIVTDKANKPRKKTRGISGSVRSSLHEEEEQNGRKIEPRQNWLAKLFRVKPATRHVCLGISQRRARQEIAQLLREWRSYGIRDVEVDKEHNVIFARIASNNYLGIREVSFACEIITVIEHGKRSHLSIIRLTQEKGSANSFHKVADTIKAVLQQRLLLVPDKRKAKMMVKTLNA